MTTQKSQRFFFGAVADEGIRATLQGRFYCSQLVTCEFNGCTWRRKSYETAEEFERRVCEDIRQMMYAAQSSAIDESQTAIVG